MSVRVQEMIHKFEVGAGARTVRFISLCVLVLGLAVLYDSCAFRNLATQDAMDVAQVGRNFGQGKGFTTQFIRPFSLFLVARHKSEDAPSPRPSPPVREREKSAAPGANGREQTPSPPSGERARVRGQLSINHPDLANAPLYPLVLAAGLKANPLGEPDLAKEQSPTIYWPDLWITVINQLLLAVSALFVFRLANRLFDAPVAWVSTIVFLVTELFWRFSVSGLSTMLLTVLVLILAGIVAAIEIAVRATPPPAGKVVRLSIAAGAVVGLAMMTRYAAGFLIVPVLILLASLSSPQRPLSVISATVAFLVVIAPWTARNFYVSGTPFGTAGYAAMELTAAFPENQLQRSIHPRVGQVDTGEYLQKLTANGRDIVLNDLPKLGGNWISALFLAGLLVPFRNPVLGRIRLFILLSIATLAVVQALGKTWLSTDSPEINSENLLVILAPLVFIYGVSLFFVLREQLNLQGPTPRALVWVVFYALVSAPLLLTIMAQHPSPLVYPPYYPPWIQQKSRVVSEDHAIMSDVPWAVAWYGNRPSVWLSLKYAESESNQWRDDFSAVNNVRKIHGLYLTAKTLKTLDIKALADWARAEAPDPEFEKLRKGISELGQNLLDDKVKPEYLDRLRAIYASIERNWVRGGGGDWEDFVLGVFVKREVPSGFPLQRAIGGIVPEIFLTEAEGERPKEASESKGAP